MGQLENEFGRIMNEMGADTPEGKKVKQADALKLFKAVSSEAKDDANEAMRGLLKKSRRGRVQDALKKLSGHPAQKTKLDEFVADANQRNPNVVTELATSWAPIRVYRNDPKNDRFTYELPVNNMTVLDDQMDTVSEIVTDATQQAMGENAAFMGQLIRDAISGEREVEWRGAD